MKSYPDVKILLGLFVVAMVAGIGGGAFNFFGSKESSTSLNQAAALLATQNLISKTPVPQPVTLGFVGDIMMDRSVKIKVDKNLGGDYNRLFENAEFLKTPDIMFGNLEGPVSDLGNNVGSIYSFRMEPEVIPALKNAGIDVVSFANNHIGDWNKAAFDDTITRLSDAGILVCGAGANKTEASKPSVVEQNGYRVGFLCFSDVGPNHMKATDTTSGILLASDPDFAQIVADASKDVSALIVSFHWGTEYEPIHSARQEELAHIAIDNGATLIAGHHPHVAQDIGEYNGVPIIYSMGNFIFDQYFSKETMQGLFVTATLDGKNILNLIPRVTKLNSNSQVSLGE